MNRVLPVMFALGVFASQYAMALAVDINNASATQLAKLKGIGLKKAESVVVYRKQHGAFKVVDDLTNVKGFGKKVLARIEKQNPGQLVVNSSSKLR